MSVALSCSSSTPRRSMSSGNAGSKYTLVARAHCPSRIFLDGASPDTPTRRRGAGSSRISSDTATELRVHHNVAALNGHGLGILSRFTDLRNESVALPLRPSATTSARRDIAPFGSTWRVTTVIGHVGALPNHRWPPQVNPE